MADNVTIIKKIKKGGAAAHGGAWKVAYADFVTAMMAFFLLLWLLNSVTQEQLEGVSNYFAPVSISESTSGAGGMFGGQTIGEEGSQQTRLTKPSVSVALPPPKLGKGGDGAAGEETSKSAEDVSEDEARKKVEAVEDAQFESAEKEIREAIEAIPALQKLGESLLIDRTEEGLRIQIVDQEGLAMFPSGSSEMHSHTKKILAAVAKVVNRMPQKVSISGHTDATKFVSNNGYGNWELSADRANASRRALVDLGVDEDRVSRVVGKAAEEPLLTDNPTHPKNRRLEIILLKNTGRLGTAIDAKDIVEGKDVDVEKLMNESGTKGTPKEATPVNKVPAKKPVSPNFLDDESLDLNKPTPAPLPKAKTTKNSGSLRGSKFLDDESLDLEDTFRVPDKAPAKKPAAPKVAPPEPAKISAPKPVSALPVPSAPPAVITPKKALPVAPGPSQNVPTPRTKKFINLDDESLDLQN